MPRLVSFRRLIENFRRASPPLSYESLAPNTVYVRCVQRQRAWLLSLLVWNRNRFWPFCHTHSPGLIHPVFGEGLPPSPPPTGTIMGSWHDQFWGAPYVSLISTHFPITFLGQNIFQATYLEVGKNYFWPGSFIWYWTKEDRGHRVHGVSTKYRNTWCLFCFFFG